MANGTSVSSFMNPLIVLLSWPDSTTRARFSSGPLDKYIFQIIKIRGPLITAISAGISNKAESLSIQGVLKVLCGNG